MWPSAGYVFRCAYRSVLPVFDVPRLVLVDSWLSSVVVGRSVGRHHRRVVLRRPMGPAAAPQLTSLDCHGAPRIALALLPLIAVAEMCSWHAVLTTWNLGHVIWAM